MPMVSWLCISPFINPSVSIASKIGRISSQRVVKNLTRIPSFLGTLLVAMEKVVAYSSSSVIHASSACLLDFEILVVCAGRTCLRASSDTHDGYQVG